mmetsp:Transcript_29881/g.40518  ORF Transcript_29881/g.40518 Transcript_29881/m.40518 type:complete len:198 (+) Transcript_29881:1287-1880(+)
MRTLKNADGKKGQMLRTAKENITTAFSIPSYQRHVDEIEAAAIRKKSKGLAAAGSPSASLATSRQFKGVSVQTCPEGAQAAAFELVSSRMKKNQRKMSKTQKPKGKLQKRKRTGLSDSDSESDGRGEDVFQANSIVDKRKRQGLVEYLVDWNGCRADEQTWERPSQIIDKGLIAQYNKAEKKRKAQAPCGKGKRVRK